MLPQLLRRVGPSVEGCGSVVALSNSLTRCPVHRSNHWIYSASLGQEARHIVSPWPWPFKVIHPAAFDGPRGSMLRIAAYNSNPYAALFCPCDPSTVYALHLPSTAAIQSSRITAAALGPRLAMLLPQQHAGATAAAACEARTTCSSQMTMTIGHRPAADHQAARAAASSPTATLLMSSSRSSAFRATGWMVQ